MNINKCENDWESSIIDSNVAAFKKLLSSGYPAYLYFSLANFNMKLKILEGGAKMAEV